jgi:hypothetical protein
VGAVSYQRGTPVPQAFPEAGLSIPNWACLSRSGPIYSTRAYLSQSGFVCTEVGLSIPERACLYPDGPIPFGLSVPRWACLYRSRLVCTQVGLCILMRAYLSECGPIQRRAYLGPFLEAAWPICPEANVKDGLQFLRAVFRSFGRAKRIEQRQRLRNGYGNDLSKGRWR